MVHGVPMRSALDDDGCEIVLRFFSLLLKIKDFNRTNKKIDIGEAMNCWNIQEFGKGKHGITGITSNKISAAHRLDRANYDTRREYLRNHPDVSIAKAASEWGITVNAAYQWILHERVRQRRKRAAR